MRTTVRPVRTHCFKMTIIARNTTWATVRREERRVRKMAEMLGEIDVDHSRTCPSRVYLRSKGESDWLPIIAARRGKEGEERERLTSRTGSSLEFLRARTDVGRREGCDTKDSRSARVLLAEKPQSPKGKEREKLSSYRGVSSSLLLKSPRQSFKVHSQLILKDSCKSLRGEIKGQRRKRREEGRISKRTNDKRPRSRSGRRGGRED